jgi:hypothetical protein
MGDWLTCRRGTFPPVLWLVAAVFGTVVVVAALTSVPARIGLRRPVAEMLQTEAA